MAYYGQEYNGKDVYYPEGFMIDMVNQEQRFVVYQKAFDELSVRDKVVCDLGAGSGLLGLEALRLGATHVYLVEMVPETIKSLQAIIDNHPQKDKITLIAKDICSLVQTDFNHQVDIFVTETFGSLLWNEAIVIYFAHVLRMFPEAKTIPEKLTTNMFVAKSDFSDSLLWPQVGDPYIVYGYRELYDTKRFQLDHTSGSKLYANIVENTEGQIVWTKESFTNKCIIDVNDKVEDAWVAGHSLVTYCSSITQSWGHMGWYFKSLENSKVEVLIENKMNPVVRVTSSY